jgi:hypothetical protein
MTKKIDYRDLALKLQLVKSIAEVMGDRLIINCPRCGWEGSLSVSNVSGHKYIVVRHNNAAKSTHTVPIESLRDTVIAVICEKKQLIEELKKHLEDIRLICLTYQFW